MTNGGGADRRNRNGDDRARTGNLRRARAALSQLSYVPNWNKSEGQVSDARAGIADL